MLLSAFLLLVVATTGVLGKADIVRSPKKLGDVYVLLSNDFQEFMVFAYSVHRFRVYTPSDDHDYSSCSRIEPTVKDNRSPTLFDKRPLYDADKNFDDRQQNVLNNMWWQAYEMLVYARAYLAPGGDTYNDPTTFKLSHSYWGILPPDDVANTQDAEPELHHLAKLTKIRGQSYRPRDSQ